MLWEIRKIATGQGDCYTTGCLLDYSYIKENINLMAKDPSKQKALIDDPKVMQQINFTGNPECAENTMFFLVEKVKEKILNFSRGAVKVL